jgi:hypothetical protein
MPMLFVVPGKFISFWVFIVFEPVGFNAHSHGRNHHDAVRHFQRDQTTEVKTSGDFINFAMKTLSLFVAANNGVNTPS